MYKILLTSIVILFGSHAIAATPTAKEKPKLNIQVNEEDCDVPPKMQVNTTNLVKEAKPDPFKKTKGPTASKSILNTQTSVLSCGSTTPPKSAVEQAKAILN